MQRLSLSTLKVLDVRRSRSGYKALLPDGKWVRLPEDVGRELYWRLLVEKRRRAFGL